MNKYPKEEILYFIKNKDKKAMNKSNTKIFDDMKKIIKLGGNENANQMVEIFNNYCSISTHEYLKNPDKTYYRIGFNQDTPKETIAKIEKIYNDLNQEEMKF